MGTKERQWGRHQEPSKSRQTVGGLQNIHSRHWLDNQPNIHSPHVNENNAGMICAREALVRIFRSIFSGTETPCYNQALNKNI